MFILIGLGNPGKKYSATRHNAGRMLAGWLKAEGRRMKDEGSQIPEGFEIVETDCFMNHSGEWITKYFRAKGQRLKAKGDTGPDSLSPYPLALIPLTVAHDDLDLPLGSFKIHFGRGPRLHKGILSIEQALGTKDFWRVRIGIEGRRPKAEGRRLSGEDYVLQPFKRDEKKILVQTFAQISKCIYSTPGFGA